MKHFLYLIAAVAVSLICNETMASSMDDKLEQLGFVNVKSVDADIVVDLMYASANNFVGKTMYETLTGAYLHPDAAVALKKAQQALKTLHPDLTLKVFDAARPMSVQRTMYNVVRGTSKARYVSNPANGGGLHNYGLAVDITIVDNHGQELDMGTHVDYLGKESNIDKENELVSAGRISRQAQLNRQLLRKVMAKGGWKPLKSEWWHFNICTRAQARIKYRILDF